jgi:hypothetical protein
VVEHDNTRKAFFTLLGRKLPTMNFLLGTLFGFSTAIGGIWWLLYVLGREDVVNERTARRSLAGSGSLRTSNSA